MTKVKKPKQTKKLKPARKAKYLLDVKCIVNGCGNCKGGGEFVGSVCVPCYEMLTLGYVDHSQTRRTFIHVLQNKLSRARELAASMVLAISQ